MELREQKKETIKKIKQSILLVEDNKISRNVACGYLLKLGYQVEIAENAGTAIEFVRNKPYTVILLDLGLPDQPGETVEDILKKIVVPWEVLQLQFGSDYSQTKQGKRDFKRAFLRELRKVTTLYQDAKLETSNENMTLKPGKPHIMPVMSAKIISRIE